MNEELLARVVDGVNKSRVDPWSVESPSASGLAIRLWLRDGKEARIWVFKDFPADHARIVLVDQPSHSSVQYPVDAPELVALTKELARQRLSPIDKQLVAPPDGKWLEE